MSADLVRRLRTACSPTSPLGILCTEAADTLEALIGGPDTKVLTKIHTDYSELGKTECTHSWQSLADAPHILECRWCKRLWSGGR